MIVSNTSPIINLAGIGHLNLLPELFGDITIPRAVFDEITVAGGGEPGADDVRSARWIRVHSVANRSLVAALGLELDPGEAEAIACALETNANLLIIDERRGRMVAQRLNQPVTGLIGVLLLARKRGLLDAIQPVLADLRQRAGFWISDALYRRTLDEAGE